MAKSNRFTLRYRRRRAGLTDYARRLKMLKSRKPRLVVRKSNAHTHVQIVEYTPDGDKIVASASTLQLEGLGWKNATGNIPAAYLAGYLAGVQAKSAKVKEAVVDIGMQKAHHSGRLFAAVKGAQDAGLSIPLSEDAVPSDDRLTGAHIDKSLAKAIDTIKSQAGKK